MFLKPSILKNLMKNAYKRGLTIARTEDDWIYIAGGYWETSIKKEFIPKRTLGDIIALTGELPDMGERFTATKEGNQAEVGLRTEVEDNLFRENNTLTVTNVILIGKAGIAERLLQNEDTGKIYVVNNVFIDIVDNSLIDKDHGEHLVGAPIFDPVCGILWKNNVCRFRALFRQEEKNKKVLKNLEGADITPEIPETGN